MPNTIKNHILNSLVKYPNSAFKDNKGLGLLSQNSRDKLIIELIDKGISSLEVLEVMRATPRHFFLDSANASFAYQDLALPIGFKQTMSSPYTIAFMLESLLKNLQTQNKVLEIGTGSGYLTALLSVLFKEVYSLEKINILQELASTRLSALELDNIHYQIADDICRWRSDERIVFDAIICAAAPAQIPNSLLAQLDLNASLVIPIGVENKQSLYLYQKTATTNYKSTQLKATSFVPLV